VALYTLKKEERLRKRKEFQAVFQEGVKIYGKHFIVYLRKNDREIRRIGIAVSRKVGRAVKRNRIKRLVREFFRLNKDLFPSGTDVVIVGKKEMPHLTYWDVWDELTETLKSATPLIEKETLPIKHGIFEHR